MFESYSKLQDNIVHSVHVHLINASPLFDLFLYWFEKKTEFWAKKMEFLVLLIKQDMCLKKT